MIPEAHGRTIYVPLYWNLGTVTSKEDEEDFSAESAGRSGNVSASIREVSAAWRKWSVRRKSDKKKRSSAGRIRSAGKKKLTGQNVKLLMVKPIILSMIDTV